MTALAAAERGLDVLVVERDPVVGSPVRCAEGVDHKGLSEFFRPDPAWVASEIDGYSLVAPDGTVVDMDIGGARGYILERLIFDRMIAEKASAAGATIMTGVEATGMSDYRDGRRTVTLRTVADTWQASARLVVAADGVESRVARWAGIRTAVSPGDMETCVQVTVAGVEVNPGRFFMHFTREFAPGGYVWVFPKGRRRANVGLGISGKDTSERRPKDYLDAFLSRHFPDASVVARTVGGVSCSKGLAESTADGLIVAGDAAQAANPITGGGIVNALIAGAYAGELAAGLFRKQNSEASVKNLAAYRKHCEERFGAGNRRCWRIKETILNLPDERFNAIAAEIVRLPLAKRTPLRVLTSAIKNNPELIPVLAKIVSW
jgi:digeranylgeranylglycerophospholipid reductase